MADPYKRIREELDHIEELVTISEDETSDFKFCMWSEHLADAIGRKTKILISEIEGFSGEPSDIITMAIIRRLRALMRCVKDWVKALEGFDTALELMYDLLAQKKEVAPAPKRLRNGST